MEELDERIDIDQNIEEINKELTQQEQESSSFGERISDLVAYFAGSWLFIISFVAMMVLWMFYNYKQGAGAFDPPPFIGLNLVLSTIAAIQAPLIMMSQKRQDQKDRMRLMSTLEVIFETKDEVLKTNEDIEELKDMIRKLKDLK